MSLPAADGTSPQAAAAGTDAGAVRAGGRAGILSERERSILLAIAEAVGPSGRFVPGMGIADIDRVDAFLATETPVVGKGFRALLWTVEELARLAHRGRSLTALDAAARLEFLESMRRADLARRMMLRAVVTPLKVAHYADPSIYRSLGCIWDFQSPAKDERPRYVADRTISGRTLTADEELECDVVVVGTGAGGAVVARELAELGLAVVMVEEGDYFTRKDFTGHSFDMQKLLYRDIVQTITVGNVGIPVPVGRTVGGSTTINAGTCYRVPPRVLAMWREKLGLTELTPEHLAPFYERVEQVLGVAPVRPEYLGGAARIIARGCDALGYKHKPLARNAPDCDGKGVCTFGCPTDAKRSTNVSYVPLALRAGASLYCAVAIDKILTEKGRAVGVAGTARESGRKVTVRARAVVVSCGTFATPLLLERSKLGGASGQLGRNLSIHPAAAAIALFDERIDAANAVPQGYAIEEFRDEGLLYEGASAPLDIGAATIPLLGRRYTEIMEGYDHVVSFGFMIDDTSRGRVRALPTGKPLITYYLNRHDVARLKRGMEILARVYFAAGARSVLPLVHGIDELHGEGDLARLRQARLHARDFDLTAYHPLGTARMGLDKRASVVGPTHEVHGTPQLFVVDGSAVPSSLSVNPQLTIMAMATRAAPFVARAVERAS